MEELKQTALAMFIKLFNGAPEIKRFSKSNLRYLEEGAHRFVEQNPNKPSKYAKMAKEGHKVMWVINYRTDKYVAVVIDGVYTTA